MSESDTNNRDQNNFVTRSELKTNLQEFRKEINEDFKLHIEVLLERYSDQTKLLAEQHQDTQREIKKIHGKLDMVIETVGDMQVDITDIKDKLDQKVDRIEFEQRLRPLETIV